MLIVGGASSVFGAVVGALLVSGIDSFLGEAENGVDIGFHLDVPTGTRLVVVGLLMAVMLVLRPAGITGGSEFRLPRRFSGRGPRSTRSAGRSAGESSASPGG
jgi:branched-chain amino acid transport system permease protein